VNQFKYIGNIMTQNMRDDADIERETKCLFARCNIFVSRFKYCSWPVKLKLFSLTVYVFIVQLFGIIK